MRGVRLLEKLPLNQVQVSYIPQQSRDCEIEVIVYLISQLHMTQINQDGIYQPNRNLYKWAEEVKSHIIQKIIDSEPNPRILARRASISPNRVISMYKGEYLPTMDELCRIIVITKVISIK